MPFLKKSAIVLCSSGSLCPALSLPASITSSSTSTTRPSPSKTAAIRTRWQWSRPYATVRDESQPKSQPPSSDEPASSSSDPEPPAWPTTKDPTPYDIFAQSRHAPYSKRIFYQLVKLYHPDRHGHAFSSNDNLSRTTKLDRYRLVVAANAILSDPVKKRAYDLYGAGWGRLAANDMSNADWREMDRAWRTRPGSAAHNATWEDWERWRDRQNGKEERQQPLYMSNALFVATLAVFVVIGSWGQAARAANSSVALVDMRESANNHISEEMWRRRKEKAILTKEDRIENFLRQREGWGHGPGNESHLPKG